MRIAVWHNLPTGGGLRLLRDHVTGLLRRGHDVVQFRPDSAEDLRTPDIDLPTHVLPLDRVADRRRHSALGKLRAPQLAAEDVASMERHASACGNLIDAGSFDVVFAGSCRFHAAAAIGRHVRTPSAQYLGEPRRAHFEAAPDLLWLGWEVNGSWADRARAAFVQSRRLGAARVRARAEVRWARSFDRLLVNSYFSRESVLRAYGVDADVCPPGVDTTRFSPSPEPLGRFVLGVGELDERKNVHLVVEAVAGLPEPRPPLVWAANVMRPGYGHHVQDLARSLGVDFDARVDVPDAELVQLYSAAAAVVYVPRLEPFGLVPLEAAACRAPVIVAAEGGLREVVTDGETGLCVLPRVPQLLAALERLLNDADLAGRLTEAAQHRVTQLWTMEASVDRVEDALKRLVEEATR